jgi:hypothetical protein
VLNRTPCRLDLNISPHFRARDFGLLVQSFEEHEASLKLRAVGWSRIFVLSTSSPARACSQARAAVKRLTIPKDEVDRNFRPCIAASVIEITLSKSADGTQIGAFQSSPRQQRSLLFSTPAGPDQERHKTAANMKHEDNAHTVRPADGKIRLSASLFVLSSDLMANSFSSPFRFARRL